MSAIQMTCDHCGAIYMAGVVGTTPWPPHYCTVLAVREALGTMKRQMASDDSTDAGFNEDMAQAIAALHRALGEHDEADQWFKPSPGDVRSLPANFNFGESA